MGQQQQAGSRTSRTQIQRLLADARTRLVETGTRNRLVHTPRGGKRARSLPILNAHPDSLFEALTQSEKLLRLMPALLAGTPALAHDRPESTRSSAPAPAAALQTSLEEEALEKRLLSIYRDAKTAEEEQGINVLFLAIGFLRWYEDDRSEVRRESPLVLVPVALVRDQRRSVFQLKGRGEDVSTNQAIQQRLRSDFGIALPDIPDHEDWSPSEYFDAVKEAIGGKARWSIDAKGVELGFYSFSKLLMIHDLDPESWNGGAILEHPLLQGLLGEGFREEPPSIPHDAKLDQLFAPADLIQVVDADSSQTIVIENVRAGRNLVVQGPPGTGKSQTITNIIASAVHDGKSVLFVAEKMAALDVVQHRLKKTGLGAICLELHSRSANKKQVLAEIEATLDQFIETPDANAEAARLAELRAALNIAAERMHAPVGNTGLTPYQALSRLIWASEHKVQSYTALFAEAASWNKSAFDEVQKAAARLIDATIESGPLRQHPFYGVEASMLQPNDLVRLDPLLATMAEAAQRLSADGAKVLSRLGLASEVTVETCRAAIAILQSLAELPRESADVVADLATQPIARVLDVAEAGVAWRQMRDEHADTFHEAAWTTPAVVLKVSLESGLSFFGRLFGDYRRASKALAALLKTPLPLKPHARVKLAETLHQVERAQELLLTHDLAMNQMLARHWRKEKTDFQLLRSAAMVVSRLKAQPCSPQIDKAVEILRDGVAAELARQLEQNVDSLVKASEFLLQTLKVDMRTAFGVFGRDQVTVQALAHRANQWRVSLDRFDQWRRLVAADGALRKVSASALAEALATGEMSAEQANPVLICSHAETVWRKAIEATPELQEFQGQQHGAVANEFRTLEVKRRATNVALVKARHAASMPRGSFGAMNAIRLEVKRKRGHMPIRKLFKVAGETLQRIKPVLLMSPISVAQFLPPTSVQFDLLVIDEASQVRPEDALGLVARAKQMVVVGDNKQLPPTSFFDRVVADEEEVDLSDEAGDEAIVGGAKATEVESILALCEARGLNSAMLRWHYRSRHPSLIEVSNAEFYRHLIMPPAPAAQKSKEGLFLTRVSGAYDRGGKRINAIEAETLARAVAEHAKASPDLSLGVVTFSSAQRDAIGELLETMRRTDEQLNVFLQEGKAEDVFVKNLENVQGDERDVIFVSVGYGPRTAGSRLDSMAFGPVSMEGGERRLNVLFTRARSRCEIFCSFAPGDIDPERARGEGPRVLKRFLQYAATGVLEEQVSTSDDFDSPFEEAVARVIEELGYKVDKQVGSAGFKIDLAVKHPWEPGRYMLAVECDGATYHRALWARERDRMRQEVLENMGWKFHRIWSTDWFYRRGSAMEKLKMALEEAKYAVVVPTKPKSAPPAKVYSQPTPQTQQLVHGTVTPAYVVADFGVSWSADPHQVPLSEMSKITLRIVEIEGPIHQDEVARRVTSLFGKSRTGALISCATLNSLQPLRKSGTLLEQGSFWMTPAQQADPPVRDRSGSPPSLQKADMLSAVEIRAAASIAIRENGALSADEMVVAVTRLLGFKRAGADLKASIEAALAES